MSIRGDFGFEPENAVRLTGRVTGLPVLREAAFGGSVITFTLYVPRLREGGDRIACCAFNDVAEELAEFVKDGDVLHVEGEIRVNPKTRAVGVKVAGWWLENGDEPRTAEAREEALRRAEAALDRQRMSIGTLLPPIDMDGRESAAWTLAMMYGAAWEDKWREHGNGEAARDESIARVYGVLKDVKFPPRADFSGDPEEE